MTTAATSLTHRILNDMVPKYNVRMFDFDTMLSGWSNSRVLQEASDARPVVRIEAYVPYLAAPNSWLATVEARIRESVLPDGCIRDSTPEWLNENAANAAIAFFRNSADVLPTEPHIYATEAGDLVAEFDTICGSMTTVVTPSETILFAVPTASPHQPLQRVLLAGSNRMREEARSFTESFIAGMHGKMESAG